MRMIVVDDRAVIARGRVVGAAFRLERRVDRATFAPRLCSSASIAGSRLSRSRRSSICTGTWRSPRCQASRASAGKIRGAHLDQRLGLGHDLDQPAVVEHQRVVGAQPHRLRRNRARRRCL